MGGIKSWVLRARFGGRKNFALAILKLTVALVLAGAALPLLQTGPVSAATVNGTPNGAGSATILDLTGAATNWQAVLTNDGVTSYVSSKTASTQSDLYALDLSTLSVSGKGKINSVTVYFWAMLNSSNHSAAAYIRTNNTNYSGTANTSLTTSFAEYSNVWTTNPNTGAEWTWAQIIALQAGVSLAKANCTQVYVVVDYTAATMQSYNDADHTTIWGYDEAHAYDSTSATAYMGGSNFTASHAYHVVYYDASATNNLKKSDGVNSDSSGNLPVGVSPPSSQYLLETDPSAMAGTWHAVTFDDEIGTGPPSTYAPGSTGAVYDLSFQVNATAIPEFPTVIAAIAVGGGCFGIYWWMRNRRKTGEVRIN